MTNKKERLEGQDVKERPKNKTKQRHKTELICEPDTGQYGVVVWLSTKHEGYAETRAEKVKETLEGFRLW